MVVFVCGGEDLGFVNVINPDRLQNLFVDQIISQRYSTICRAYTLT
jgi:hypothetical protein